MRPKARFASARLAVAHDRAVEAVEHGVADGAGHLLEDRLLRRVVEHGIAREREQLLLGAASDGRAALTYGDRPAVLLHRDVLRRLLRRPVADHHAHRLLAHGCERGGGGARRRDEELRGNS
eukprot:scaffold114536_cov60-Phaeocystis_antarctica.AAC.4